MKDYLKEKFAFNGYDKDFLKSIDYSKKGLEAKLNYYISLIVKELNYRGKTLELTENMYEEIDEWYINMI